ncbi:MAG: hypothetical protein M1830_001605, partial [Pleopsidium flavum]
MSESEKALAAEITAWTIAREQYLHASGLSKAECAERERLLASSSDDVMGQLKRLEAEHAKTSKPRRWSARLQPLIDWLARFGPALDVFANADPHGVLSLVATDFHNWFEEVVIFLEEMPTVLQRLNKYEELYRNHVSLRTELSKVYLQLLDLLGETTAIFRKAHSKMIPVLLWRNHSATFEKRASKLKGLCDETYREAYLIGEQEADVFRKRSSRFQKDSTRARQEYKEELTTQKKDKMWRKVNDWLAPTAIHADHERIQKELYRGTCEWILDNPTISAWISLTSPEPLLWISGIPGSGKTHTSSFIVEYLKETHLTAYFYCDTKDDRKRTLLGILRTWASQLLSQRPHLLADVYKIYERKRAASVSDVIEALQILLASYDGTQCVLILDGLDECEPLVRGQCLALLPDLLPSAKVLLVSRDEGDIRLGVESLGSTCGVATVKITVDDTQSDIYRMVVEEVKQLYLEDESLDQAVSRRLIEGANGMFLWIRLMIDQLSQQATIEEVEEALEDLPTGLNDTYGRLLLRILNYSPAKRTIAEKILRWMVCASRPLSVAELGEALAISGGEDRFNPKKRVINPRKTILDLCAPLIELEEPTQRLKLVHASVKDFLLSTTIRDEASRSLRVDERLTQSEIAKVCLTYLSYGNREFAVVNSDVEISLRNLDGHLKAHPFLEYSTLNWWIHAQSAIESGKSDNPSDVIDEMRTVLLRFMQSESTNVKWLQAFHYLRAKSLSSFVHRTTEDDGHGYGIQLELRSLVHLLNSDLSESTLWFKHLEDGPRWRRFLSKRVPVYCYPPIHLASIFDFVTVIDSQLENGVAVDMADHMGQTPLIAASRCEAPSAANFLIDKGADINKPCTWSGVTPLHEVFCSEASSGDISFKMLPLFLKAGSDVQARDHNSYTALHDCCSFRAHEARLITWAVERLLQHGADPHTTTKYNETALHLLAKRDLARAVVLLLDHGACPNGIPEFLDNSWRTPLYIACNMRRSRVAPILTTAGADVNAADGKSTPLHAASNVGSEHVELLIKSGADVNVLDEKHCLPIHYAALGDLNAARGLITAGSRLDVCDQEGRTPLIIALESRSSGIVSALLEAGSGLNSNLQRSLNRISMNIDIWKPWAEKQHWWHKIKDTAVLSSNRQTTPQEIFHTALILKRQFPREPPKHIVPMILEMAECWLHRSVTRTDLVAVTLHDDADQAYIKSRPIVGTPASPVRKVVITITSRDQGWSDWPEEHGTYTESNTWFDVTAENVNGHGEQNRLDWIVRNQHGGGGERTHTVVLESQAHYSTPTREGAWVNELKNRQILSVIPRARYLNWVNYVF